MGRQCITGTGKKPRDYSRMGFTYKHKLDALRFLDVIPDTGKAVEKFYPFIDNQDERRKRIKLISDWNHSRVFIESMCSMGKGHFKRARKLGDGAILPDGAEEYLVMWISSLRREGCPVSAQMLQFKALEVAADRGISPELFRASYSWRKGFLRRNKLSIRAKTRRRRRGPRRLIFLSIILTLTAANLLVLTLFIITHVCLHPNHPCR
ncbi:hypothetical protein DVH05_000627 [Phytophthora capsici]|nr:hypothetical protein DVH05_016901 [Phytophthora capsici]KAG1712892.1 hypothetical protein DVH05_000627 [Phytophthora capsici]|eukprot:jgi/Phyca11/553032/estExt2_Genewise1Plus.C_PHYCAscaffold_500329